MIRKINILNKDYENVGLDASNPRLSGFTLREVFEENEIPSNISGEELGYWEKVYNYLKNGTKESGFAYVPTSRFSIDKPIKKLNNNTLRDIFEVKFPQIRPYKLNNELYNYIDYDNLVFYENLRQVEIDGSDIQGSNGLRHDDNYIYVYSNTYDNLGLTNLLENGLFKNNLFGNSYNKIEPDKDSMTMSNDR